MMRVTIGNSAPPPGPAPQGPAQLPPSSYLPPDLVPLSGPIVRRPLFPRIEWFLAGLVALLGASLWELRSAGASSGLPLAAPFLVIAVGLLWAQWRGEGHLNSMFVRRQVREAFSLAIRRQRWDWLRLHVPLVTRFEGLQGAFRTAVVPVSGLLSLVSDPANTFIPQALKASAYRDARATMEEIVGVALRVALLGHFSQPADGLIEDVQIVMDRLTEVGRRAAAAQEALGKLTLGATADTLEEARAALGTVNWMATEQHRLESTSTSPAPSLSQQA